MARDANKQERESYIQVILCLLALWPYQPVPLMISWPFWLLLEEKKNPFLVSEWLQNRAHIPCWRWPVLGVFFIPARFWFAIIKTPERSIY